MSKWNMNVQVSDKLTQWLTEHGGVEPSGEPERTEHQDDICPAEDACPVTPEQQDAIPAAGPDREDSHSVIISAESIAHAGTAERAPSENACPGGDILDLPVNQLLNQKAAQNRQQQDERMMQLCQEGKDVNWMEELERASYERTKHDVVILRDKLQKMQEEMYRLQAELDQERDLKQEAIRAANEAKDAERILRTALAEAQNSVTDLPAQQNDGILSAEEWLTQFIKVTRIERIELTFDVGR